MTLVKYRHKAHEVPIKFDNHPFHIITNQTNIKPLRKRGGLMFYRNIKNSAGSGAFFI